MPKFNKNLFFQQDTVGNIGCVTKTDWTTIFEKDMHRVTYDRQF
jgi:hypothetical protein